MRKLNIGSNQKSISLDQCRSGLSLRDMSRRAKPFALLGMLSSLFFPGCQGKASSQQSEDVLASYALPTYPSLVHFGQERVYSQDGKEITWDGFYSDDAPSAIVSFYKERLGELGFEATADGATWRFPPDDATKVLSIMPVSAAGPHTVYRESIPVSALSVVIVSRR